MCIRDRPCNRTIELLSFHQIVRIEALQNYCRFHLEDGNELVSTNNLRHYKSKLEGHRFYQCHKSFLIQIDKIVRFHKEGYMEMVDGAMIPVARRRREEFINQILSVTDLH